MRVTSRVAWCLVLLAFLSLPAYALEENGDDDESRELLLLFDREDVVVAATKRRVSVQKAPSIASVIGASEIRRAGARTLVDALRLVPGLETSLDTLGSTRLAVRGKRSAPQVLVMLDGMTLNDVYDGSPLLDLPAGMIERIEVIRGPGSALYGTNAFAGTVNVVTRQESELTAALLGGSYATAGAETIVAIGNKPFLHLYAHGERSDGPAFAIEADRLSSRGQGLAGGPRGETEAWRQGATAGLTLTRPDVFRAGDRLQLQARTMLRRAGPYFGPFDTLAPDATVARDEGSLQGTWDARWTSGMEVTTRVYGLQRAVDRDLQLSPDGYTTGDQDGDGDPEVFPEGQRRRERYLSRMAGAETQLRFSATARDTFTAGAQMEWAALPSYSLVTNEENGAYRGPELANYREVPLRQRDESRAVLGLFLQEEREIASGLGLTVGVRHDQYTDFGGTTNPRAGVVWSPSEALTFKLLYGTAFRAPTFQELYDRTEEDLRGAFIGNEDLEPETIRTAEVGAEARMSVMSRPLSLRANAYYDEVRGRIDEVQSAGTINRLRNAGDVNTVGGEIEGRVLFPRRSSLFANAAWFRAADLRSHTYITDVPQWRVNAGFYVSPIEALTVYAIYQAGAERRNNARSTLERLHDFRIPAYGLVNLTVSSEPLWKHWTIAASIYDVLDQKTFDDVPRPDRVTGNLPTGERTFWLRLGFQR